ncbi:glutamate--cysteine ligase [Umboniibacter marinipuniceus]|uniref:Glutamate--cysteine ligase n=1 Tax=Umboniibacter marinipuniceus TaxID=569599 RepID=A0A3M0AAK6_9GAMM|nr:glutamate--cysteine ligase [Umboniibacter marinipuniceus]RMA82183.1 glutamate-cysteine ligase [Umboniibacter marinipuniceus]
MSTVFNALQRAIASKPDILQGAKRGIERECLRISRDGHLAMTPHPTALGSALTHGSITTDYSEALLEFITQPHDDIASTLAQLDEIHRYTTFVLEQQGEMLWPASMPCIMAEDDAIPVAQYGSSNSAQLKTTYRHGLGNRYGRLMQTIAGIHYNYSISDSFWQFKQQQLQNNQSLQDFKTDQYFGVIRNFRRNFWLLMYLFGASPLLCQSFVKNNPHHQLKQFTHCTYGGDQATSLRMGDLGYQSNAQASLTVSYNELPSYLKTLKHAIVAPHPEYQHIGVKVEGEYRQLSDALLQIENEFYSTIRPKRTAQRGETALHALQSQGVEYIEVRCLDINPYDARGISSEQCHFVEVFMTWCAMTDSPLTTQEEYDGIAENQKRVVNQGRELSLSLYHRDGDRILGEWASATLSELEDVAALLDAAEGGSAYSQAVLAQYSKVTDSNNTLSAQFAKECLTDRRGFAATARIMAKQHHEYWLSQPLSAELHGHYQHLAATSLDAQDKLEAADSMSFDDYLAQFMSQYRDLKV